MSDQVLEKLNKMDDKLDELLRWKAAHQESHKIIDRDIIEVRDTLFENPGLKSQVQTLINCKQNISRWRNFWIDVLKFVTVAAIVAVLTWCMVLYQKGGLNEAQQRELLIRMSQELTEDSFTEKEN